MLWLLIMIVVGIILIVFDEYIWCNDLTLVVGLVLIFLGIIAVMPSIVIVDEGFGHTDVVSVSYTDGTIVRDDKSSIYLIRVERKSYWNWIDDVTTYELKRQNTILVHETKDKSKILEWFEKPDIEFKF